MKTKTWIMNRDYGRGYSRFFKARFPNAKIIKMIIKVDYVVFKYKDINH